MVERPLATDPLSAGRGHLPTAAGPEGDDPQALGWSAEVGGAGCGGSVDLPGHRAGAHAIFDPKFHPHSFGFRPGRSQHHAVERARQFIADDAAWCVDFDLDSFFDRVQRDALMARVARRVDDKQVLGLIRRYLEAGVMDGGLVAASEEGTPQGSPLSPLLSNVMLDDLDWELDRRGHRFVRFADDGRIYVSSERAGQRVMASITQYIEQRLKLRVNRQKSAVAQRSDGPFWGSSSSATGTTGSA